MRIPALAALGLAFALAPASPAQVFVKGGLDVATFSGDDVEFLFEEDLRDEPRLGVVGGAGVRLPMGRALAFQVEALYAQKGSVFRDEFGGDYRETNRLDYLEVPASVRLALPAGRLLDVGLTAGGYVGVPLNGEIAFDNFGDTGVNDLETRTDYGGLVGVDVGSGGTFVEARYTFGLTDAVDYDPALDFAPDYRNRSLTLTLGFALGGPRRY